MCTLFINSKASHFSIDFYELVLGKHFCTNLYFFLTFCELFLPEKQEQMSFSKAGFKLCKYFASTYTFCKPPLSFAYAKQNSTSGKLKLKLKKQPTAKVYAYSYLCFPHFILHNNTANVFSCSLHNF